MVSLIVEILLLILLVCFTIVLGVYQKCHKDTSILPIFLTVLGLIDFFVLIHLLFCYQVGFPASVTQNCNTDLTLTAADWLGFLGGYLGFAGSLVMAYLVYRQNNIINSFTISEYIPSASLIIQKCVKSTDIPNFHGENLLQPILNKSSDKYYTVRCIHSNESNVKCETFEVLIFLEIVNNSKTTINKFSFSTIELKEIESGGNSFYFTFCKKYDPADGITEILPGRKLKRCIMIENIPCVIDTSWLTIGFLCGESQSITTSVLVKKTDNDIISFLNISE